jgi:hypothetical protein
MPIKVLMPPARGPFIRVGWQPPLQARPRIADRHCLAPACHYRGGDFLQQQRRAIAMTDNYLPAEEKNETRILIEGPAWGDAEFYGQWLLNAAKAQKLLEQARNDDPSFHSAVEVLEILQILDYGIMATVLLSQLDKKFHAFLFDPDSSDVLDFALMVEMGFFTLTGDRYQMTLPRNLDMDRVKQAHLKVVGTDDGDWVHPERLLIDMPHARAVKFQRLLRAMDENQRLADRRALLFAD